MKAGVQALRGCELKAAASVSEALSAVMAVTLVAKHTYTLYLY